MTQSVGDLRVRRSFNPAKDNLVELFKQLTAQLIDLCEDHKHKDPRLAALAQTTYEEAAMWAVKLATAKENV
jgi:hypothetical protein